MSNSIHVAVLGGSGYGAGELLRLLTQHPDARVVCVTSSSHAGRSVGEAHPHLRGFYDLRFSKTLDTDKLLAGRRAVIFSALPHGISAAMLDGLLNQHSALRERTGIIDLSGDLRLADTELHQRHYPDTPVLPHWRSAVVYGLPELFREAVRGALFVANPGCLAMASILAAAPLARVGLSGVLCIDAKTGSSGSGRALKEATHHPTRHADFRAYKPLQHRHEPEILQAFGDPYGQRLALSFVAQSMNTTRGIFVTVHLTLPAAESADSIRGRYEDFYADKPFVRIVSGSPALQNVVGSNFCDISVACRDRQVIAMAAIDNLVKGMSGTAIQNMNLMCGLPETTGLWIPSFRPL